MARQEVNAERISSAANRLRTGNNNINNEFSTLRNRMRQLESWRGAAGTAAQTTMHQLFNHNEARSTVMQNYLNMLERQINPGYQNTESTNRSLADKFK
jgi:uncharacterized protein YukE